MMRAGATSRSASKSRSYTDGVTDAVDLRRERYEMERLSAAQPDDITLFIAACDS